MKGKAYCCRSYSNPFLPLFLIAQAGGLVLHSVAGNVRLVCQHYNTGGSDETESVRIIVEKHLWLPYFSVVRSIRNSGVVVDIGESTGQYCAVSRQVRDSHVA